MSQTAVRAEDLLDRVGHRRAVVVDPDLYGSLNVATMICALEGLLIAYPGLVAKHDLEVVVDLRGLFEDSGELAEFSWETLWPRFRKDVLCVAPPIEAAYAHRDYAIAAKLFTFWIPSGCDLSSPGTRPRQENALVARVLAESPPLSLVIGSLGDGNWRGVGRDRGVKYLSRFGKVFVPMDLGPDALDARTLSNLSLPAARAASPASPSPSARSTEVVGPEKGKIYLATLSESGGDPADGDPSGLVYESAAVLDLDAYRVLHRRSASSASAGASGLGAIDLATFGSALPDRASVLSRYFTSLEEAFARHGLSFLTDGSGARLDASGFDASPLPALPILAAHDPARPIDPLTAAYRLGRAAVFHDVGAASLQALLQNAGDPYLSLSPLFLWTRSSTLSAIQSERSAGGSPALPENVVRVSPSEIFRLYGEWSRLRRVTEIPLVAGGAEWRYDDSGKDLGVAWRDPDFDDSGWAQGRAELGYGDAGSGNPEATVLSYGGNSSSKHLAYYFRKTIRVPADGRVRLLVLGVVADDGCAVYLGGEEIHRYNLPPGEPTFQTRAQRSVSGASEHQWRLVAIDASRLKEGRNTIAVEVHQSSPTSSDLSFDLKLTGYRVDAARSEPDSE